MDKPFKEPKEVKEPKAKKCVVKECICEPNYRNYQCCKHGSSEYKC